MFKIIKLIINKMSANCIPFSNKTNNNEYSEDNETINLNNELISNNEEKIIHSNDDYENNINVGILIC